MESAVAGMDWEAVDSLTGGRNMKHGSTIFTLCQVILWYRSNALWKSVEKPGWENERRLALGGG